jgi:hypothetical protein
MVVYKTFSFIQVLISGFLKIGYLCAAAIILYHYNENPIVTTIVAAICILFFLLTGRDSITVYSDAIEYNSGSILRMLRRRKAFKIKDIAAIKVDGVFSTGDELYNPTISKDKSLNNIEVELKNGSIVNIQTSIYIDKLKRAELEINKLLHK